MAVGQPACGMQVFYRCPPNTHDDAVAPHWLLDAEGRLQLLLSVRGACLKAMLCCAVLSRAVLCSMSHQLLDAKGCLQLLHSALLLHHLPSCHPPRSWRRCGHEERRAATTTI